jgi:hypothetical protein
VRRVSMRVLLLRSCEGTERVERVVARRVESGNPRRRRRGCGGGVRGKVMCSFDVCGDDGKLARSAALARERLAAGVGLAQPHAPRARLCPASTRNPHTHTHTQRERERQRVSYTPGAERGGGG